MARDRSCSVEWLGMHVLCEIMRSGNGESLGLGLLFLGRAVFEMSCITTVFFLKIQDYVGQHEMMVCAGRCV